MKKIIALIELFVFGASMFLGHPHTKGLANSKEFEVTAPVHTPYLKIDRSVTAPVTALAQVQSLVEASEYPKIPCQTIEIVESGAICDGYRVEFPEVNMQDVLDGKSNFPSKSELIFVSEKTIDGVRYKNFFLVLRWESTTPEFLQVYLEDYIPRWDNRVPYSLYWNAHYEMCEDVCSSVYMEGEVLPSDVKDLSPSLAADTNYNGTPAAFWNGNVQE